MRKTLKINQTLYFNIHNGLPKWRNYLVMCVQIRTPYSPVYGLTTCQITIPVDPTYEMLGAYSLLPVCSNVLGEDGSKSKLCGGKVLVDNVLSTNNYGKLYLIFQYIHNCKLIIVFHILISLVDIV